MTLKLNPDAFFESSEHCEAFDALLYQATSTGSSLKLDLSDATISIKREERGSHEASKLDLSGVSQFVLDQSVPNAAQIFYPLLGRIQSLEIPANKIYALRSHNRSIADFWARNLFHALSSTRDVSFTETDEANANESSVLEQMTKVYFWVLRDALPDETLSRKDILSKLTLDFYFPVLSFDSVILRTGMTALRRLNARTIEEQRMSEEERQSARRFNDCRRELLSVLNG